MRRRADEPYGNVKELRENMKTSWGPNDENNAIVAIQFTVSKPGTNMAMERWQKTNIWINREAWPRFERELNAFVKEWKALGPYKDRSRP
jgi:hypothetical protein